MAKFWRDLISQWQPERQQWSQDEIDRVSSKLRVVYNAQGLLLITTKNAIEFMEALKKHSSVEGQESETFAQLQLDYSPFGMMYFSPKYTKSNQPLILIRLDAFPKETPLEDELVHEFSNFEADKRWGKELDSFKTRINRHFAEVSFEFQQQTASLEGELFDAAQIALDGHRTARFAFFDGPVSVPADFVTIERGFATKLLARKKAKIEHLQFTGPGVSKLLSEAALSLHFPYFAYMSFHPHGKAEENGLDSLLESKLTDLKHRNLMDPIRRIRKLLHDIRDPVTADKLYSATTQSEKIYLNFAENHTGTIGKEQWGKLRRIAARLSISG